MRYAIVTVFPASRLAACAVWLSSHNVAARAAGPRPYLSALLLVTAALDTLHPRRVCDDSGMPSCIIGERVCFAHSLTYFIA